MGKTCGSQHFVSLRKLIVTHPCLFCQPHQITFLQDSNSNKGLQKTSHWDDMENGKTSHKKSVLTQKWCTTQVLQSNSLLIILLDLLLQKDEIGLYFWKLIRMFFVRKYSSHTKSIKRHQGHFSGHQLENFLPRPWFYDCTLKKPSCYQDTCQESLCHVICGPWHSPHPGQRQPTMWICFFGIRLPSSNCRDSQPVSNRLSIQVSKAPCHTHTHTHNITFSDP